MFFFYLAYTDLYVKIGRTQYPKKRKSDLISGCPLKLKVIFKRETVSMNERTLHKKFKEHRLHHEWFNFHGEIKTFIRELGSFEIENNKSIEIQSLYVLEREDKETTQEPVRIIKTTRMIDFPDAEESIILED